MPSVNGNSEIVLCSLEHLDVQSSCNQVRIDSAQPMHDEDQLIRVNECCRGVGKHDSTRSTDQTK